MAEAICLRCGAAKSRPWQKCRRCGFSPEADQDCLVKSVYLSVARFDDSARAAEYEAVLDVVGKRIRAGHEPEFDLAELDRLAKQREVVESVPMSAVWGALFRFFLPGLGVLIVLVLIALYLRTLR